MPQPQVQTPVPFNDLARTWDPMMPQTQYDDLRHQYFRVIVMPRFRPEQAAAAWEDFKGKTERAKAIDNPLAAQAKLFALSAGARVEGFVRENSDLQKKKDALITRMERDGLDTKAAQTTGTLLPDMAAFVALDAATAGVGGLLEAGVEAGSIVSKAGAVLKGTSLAGKVARGGLAFGTFQVLTEQQGANPGYSFLTGAAQGAAYELGLAGLGRLLSGSGARLSKDLLRKRGQEAADDLLKPKSTSAEVSDTLGKPNMGAADKTLAQSIAAQTERARQEGLPLNVQIDNRAWKPIVRGIRVDGSVFSTEGTQY